MRQLQIEHSDLSKPIYEKLKAMIINQELKPGQKIVQEKISSELGVSRTPLAKALQMLEYEMLVESKPRRGMYVKQIDLKEMLEIFECREALEALATRLIVENNNDAIVRELELLMEPFVRNPQTIKQKDYAKADEQFHQKLIDATENSVLGRLYFFGNIHDKIAQMGLVRAPEETLGEHIKIIEALKNKDAKQAETEAASHIRKSRHLINKAIQEHTMPK